MREVTRTPLGADVPELVLEAIQSGVALEITCGGQVCRVADPESALALLAETFEWNPGQGQESAGGKPSDDATRS